VRVKYQPRHYDYVLGPTQAPILASIAAGQIIQGIPLTLDSDAPFLLRGRAMRIPYPVRKDCAKIQPLNNLLMRFTGPNNNYLADSLVRQSLEMAYFGQFGQWSPVFPQILYPPAGTILVDVQNDGLTEIDNLTLYFRGVKLYPVGARPGYTYPPQFSTLPFVYPIVPVDPNLNPAGLIQALGVTETRLNQIFKVKDDADFVIRSGQAMGTEEEHEIFEVFMILRDPDNLPYSNDYVHTDVLFGYGQPTVEYPVSSGGASGDLLSPAGVGPANPGWFYPEIYVPRNQILKYDIKRTDAAYTGCSDVLDLPVVLTGSKVFHK
jgi:hypothetical protein